LAPTSAADHGKLQLLAWNIGTTGRTTERASRSRPCGITAAKVCSRFDRCSNSTPLGSPVVPLV